MEKVIFDGFLLLVIRVLHRTRCILKLYNSNEINRDSKRTISILYNKLYMIKK